MGALFDRIRVAIEAGRYVIGSHAMARLRWRQIPAWQVAAGTLEGRLIRERPRARPNPAVEVSILLADGTAAVAVWSWLRAQNAA